MEQQLKNELLHARRSFRSIASKLYRRVYAAKNVALTSEARRAVWTSIERQVPAVCRECHAIADLADQWQRSGQTPTDQDWVSFMKRVHEISAITTAWDGELNTPSE
jgi:hypothetical protein